MKITVWSHLISLGSLHPPEWPPEPSEICLAGETLQAGPDDADAAVTFLIAAAACFSLALHPSSDAYHGWQCSSITWLLIPPVPILQTTSLSLAWLYTLWGNQPWPCDQAWQAMDSSQQRQTSISSPHYLLEFKSYFVNFYCVWARLGTETTLFKPSTLVSSTALHKSDYMVFLFYDSDWGMENSSRLCV